MNKVCFSARLLLPLGETVDDGSGSTRLEGTGGVDDDVVLARGLPDGVDVLESAEEDALHAVLG